MIRPSNYSFTAIVSVLIIVMSGLILAGWIFFSPVLMRILPGFETIKFNSAICFLIYGFALLAQAKGKEKSKIVPLGSTLVIIISLLTFSQYLFGWNIGIDQLLWEDKITMKMQAGRMSPATAINFILVGISLLFLNRRIYLRVVQGLILATLFISALIIIVNDLAAHYFNILPLTTTMSIPTALMFVLLSLGIFYFPTARNLTFNLEWKLGISFSIIVFIVFISFYIFSETFKSFSNTSERVEHTNEVLYTSEQLISALKDVQTNSTFHLITGSEKSLFLHDDSDSLANHYLTRLRQLTSDNPEQQKLIDTLKTTIARFSQFNLELVSGVGQENLSTQTDSINSIFSERLMTDIREINRVIQKNEKNLLQTRKYLNQRSSEKASTIIIFFQLLIIFLLASVFFIVRKNITERNKAEADLQTSRDWFSTTLSSIGDAVIATDNFANITFMNQVAQELTGWNETESKGLPLDVIFNIINEESRSMVESPVGKVLKYGNTTGLANHTLLIRKDKTEVPIDDSAAPIFNAEQQMIGVVLVFRDVTKQKENELAIKESEEKFQKAFQSIAAGISITRISDGKFLEMNNGFLQMTGYTREELIGRSSTDLNLVVDVAKREDILRQVRETGSARNFEIRVRNKSGRIFEVLSSVDSIFLKKEKFAINVLYDITERKRAEEELESVNKELESFSYSISHDLRAPLRSITGYTSVLEEDYNEKLDQEGKRVLGIIRRNSLKMNDLIDDLLAFSKLGKRELKKSEIDIQGLVQNTLNEITLTNSHKAQVIIKSLFSVYADLALLTQVWINLISNALKYSAKTENPTVEIGSFKDKNETVYYVKDNGAGFDMQFASKLFGVFQRLHKTNEFEGTGIGLSIVKRIITKHGGRVWAEGKVNEGAVFYFSLPDTAYLHH